MTDFNLTLGYLRDAIQEDLGDIAPLLPAGFLERAINEGQRRLEPGFVLYKTLTPVSIAAGSETYALPTDLIQIDSFQTDPYTCDLASYYQHGNTLYFHCPTSEDFSGKLHYRAHYPAITDDADCQLPAGAADALISFGLYKSFRRIAANRAEYRKFATIVGNGVTMADLEASAEAHLQDFTDAADAALVLPLPANLYGD